LHAGAVRRNAADDLVAGNDGTFGWGSSPSTRWSAADTAREDLDQQLGGTGFRGAARCAKRGGSPDARTPSPAWLRSLDASQAAIAAAFHLPARADPLLSKLRKSALDRSNRET
jgi:hypothetical protein